MKLALLPALALATLAAARMVKHPTYAPTSQTADPWDGKHRKTCVVPSHGDLSKSDVPAIKQAFKRCGNHGKIVFAQNETYAINDLLVIEGCKKCIVEWDGLLQQSSNISRILETQTFFTFQNKSTNILLKGAHGAYIHSPAGTGELNGNGQVWWEANKNASDLDPGTLRRPILFMMQDVTHSVLDGLRFDKSPNWNMMVMNSSYVTVQNMNITSLSNSTTLPKNTDGLDTYNVNNFLFQNSSVVTGDDCIAFKGNNTEATAQNLYCEGTHGTSVGSLAQYKGIHDYISGVYVNNVTFEGGQNALRIKVWPSGPERGTAYVENVFFNGAEVRDIDTPIFIESCYQTNATECARYPSQSTMKNIHIDHVFGTSSGAKKSVVGDLRCPPSANYTIYLSDIQITPGGNYTNTTGTFLCAGLATDLGVPCVAA